MSSETSTENNINYLDNNGKKILSETKKETKKQTSDTDFYFNMVANKEKIVVPTLDESESSDIKISSSSSSKKSSSTSSKSSSSKSSTSTKKPYVETFNFSNDMTGGNNQFNNTTQFSNNNQSNVPNISAIPILTSKSLPTLDPTVNVKVLTPQEIRIKKIELLRRLSEIKMKCYSLSKEYDFNSSVEEMQYEYDLLKSFAEKRNGIKIYKNVLLNVTSAIEFMNDKYDPFDFHLSGWSEHLAYDIDSYDDVLEDLYEKYKGSGKKMAPEVKLLLLIVASASAFHFTKSQTMPVQIPQNVTSGILNNVINSKKESSQFMTEQEMNIEKLRAELKAKEKQLQQPPQMQQPQQMPQPQQMQQPPRQQPPQQPRQQQSFEPVAANAKPHLLPPQVNVPIKAPENVKDILNRLHSLQPTKVNINPLTDTQDESANNDRLLSETTVSDSAKRKSATKTKKKANISII